MIVGMRDSSHAQKMPHARLDTRQRRHMREFNAQKSHWGGDGSLLTVYILIVNQETLEVKLTLLKVFVYLCLSTGGLK